VQIYVPEGDLLTWDSARTKIRGDLWRPGTNAIPDDVVNRALHSSLLDLEGECRWLWLERVNAGLRMPTNADSLSLPASVLSISSLSVIRGAMKYRLLQAPAAFVRELAVNSPGTPSRYYLSDGVIFFDSIVPKDTLFEMWHTTQTPELLDDAVNAASPTLYRHQQAVIAKAASYCARGYLKNSEEADRQEAVYESILMRLFNRESQQRDELGGGSIFPDDSYARAAWH
jgi:hypothetical protein